MNVGSGLVDSWTVECSSDVRITQNQLGATAPLWDDIGIDSSVDGSSLYFVSPETDELVHFNPTTMTEIERFDVGIHPFDVVLADALVPDILPNTKIEERAFVLNHGEASTASSETLTVLDPSNGNVVTRILDTDFSTPDHLGPTRLATAMGLDEAATPATVRARFVYISATELDRLLVYDVGVLPGVTAETPTPALPISVGESPGAIAFPQDN